MRISHLSLLIAASLPAAAGAQAKSESIDCVYKGVSTADVLLFIEEEEKSKTEPAKAAPEAHAGAVDRLRRRMEACVAQYEWAPHQAEPAVAYAFGRAMADLAIADLGRKGLPPVLVVEVVADFGAEKIAAMVEQRADAPSNEEFGVVAIKRMMSHGYSGSMEEPEMEAIGEMVGRAIGGRYASDLAIRNFNAPAPAAAR